MPTFIGNMVRVAWKMISGAWKGASEFDPFTWGAHETDGISEATWADYATGGSNPTTWDDLSCPMLVDPDSNSLSDQDGNKLIS